MEQPHYVGLDVSLETTSICVVDHNGAIVWRGKCSTEPEPIRETVRKHAPALVRVGLETGQLSNSPPRFRYPANAQRTCNPNQNETLSQSTMH
jgi:hypothetical protein